MQITLVTAIKYGEIVSKSFNIPKLMTDDNYIYSEMCSENYQYFVKPLCNCFKCVQ